MGYRALAVIGLLCAAMARSGCASKLDFDQVSAGRDSTDAEARSADAASASPTAADAASAFDASSTAQATPNDASMLAASAGPGDGATDAGPLDRQRAADTAEFSCQNVSPAPYFCDDFESFALLDHWTDIEVYPWEPVLGGSIEIDSSAARAGQDSLLVQVNEGVGACDNCLYLLAGLALPDLQGPTKVTTEFDLRVEQIDPTINRRVVLFQLLSGTPEAGFTQHTFQLESRGGSVRAGLVEFDTEGESRASAEASSTVFEHEFAPTPALARWAHVIFTLDAQDPRGTGNVARLRVDDLLVFDGALQYAPRDTKVRLELGVPWVDMTPFAAQDTTKIWRIRYDNVVVRHEPR